MRRCGATLDEGTGGIKRGRLLRHEDRPRLANRREGGILATLRERDDVLDDAGDRARRSRGRRREVWDDMGASPVLSRIWCVSQAGVPFHTHPSCRWGMDAVVHARRIVGGAEQDDGDSLKRWGQPDAIRLRHTVQTPEDVLLAILALVML